MPIYKRSDNDPAPASQHVVGAPRSGLIKRDSVVHEEGAAAVESDAAFPPSASVRIVGDPTASRGGPAASALTSSNTSGPRPQAAVNAAAEKAIIDRAQEEAAAIVKDAMEKTEALKNKVYADMQAAVEANNDRCQEAFLKAQEDGFARGQTEGVESAKAEFLALMEEAKNVFNQAVAGREALFKTATGEIARLALKVAERVIGHEVNINEEVVLHTIKMALEKVKARESVTIRCHPSDVEYVRMNRDIFERMIEGLKQFEVQSDAKVERGGCILETNLGNVDARIQTQLAVLHLAFGEVERLQQDADS